MTCDSGGLTGEMRPQEALAASQGLERTGPSHGAMVLGAVPRHAPPQLGAVVFLRRGTGVGSGEETRGGAETVVRSLRKDALGRPCNCNGSCASQQVPTRLLRLAPGLHGPVECAGLLVHLDRGHGVTASLPDVMGELPRELHYVAADFTVGDGRPLLALQIAPVSTRVLSKWTVSLEDLSYLHEMPMRLLHLASGPYGAVECARLLFQLERGHGITASLLDAIREMTKGLHYVAGDCTLGDGRPLLALQIAPVSTRTVWPLLNNNTRNFQGNTSGTMHMEAFKNMCFKFNSTQIIPCDSSSLQKYQATNKESGHWLLKDGLDGFNTSYVGFPKKWPMDISLEDLLSYLHDAKAASLLEDKTTVCGEVDCGKAMKGCVASFPMLLLMVDEKTSIYNSILNMALSTKDASTHDRSERREAVLFGCRTLPPLPNTAKVGDATESDSVLVSIFVRHAHVPGGLVLTINLDESSQHMMCLYAQKTNTKLELQYFIYGKKRLEPDSTLLSYGVRANSTIHVCSRLHGGVVTITNFLAENQKKLLKEVTLPDGKVSLEMTKIGCLFLSTWLKCFTRAFANSKSWNGKFTLDHFKVVYGGHVLVITGAGADANVRLDSSSMEADMARLVQYITAIFKKNKSNLISQFPPYLENLTTFLGSMKSPVLYNTDRLFIETHLCCVESAARGVLLAMVQRKFKSLSDSHKKHWNGLTELINPEKTYVSAKGLSGVPVFQDIITEAGKRGESYGSSKPSIFRLMRDHFIHGPSHRFNKSFDPWQEKFKNDDGIELMIPAHNKDFLPEIIYTMIKDKKVDIKAELLEAQVRCTCHICHPPHPDSKGKGESSTAGKGKQPESESSGSSQPSTPSSRQGPPPAWQQPQAAESSGSSQPSTPSSRQGPPTPWQQPQAAASSGSSRPPSSRPGSYQGAHAGRPSQWRPSQAAAWFSQSAAPRPPAPAPAQQQSSSSEWQTAKGKGKGKRYD